MLLHDKGGKRLKKGGLKTSKRFCSQMFDSNSYLQAVHWCRVLSLAQLEPD